MKGASNQCFNTKVEVTHWYTNKDSQMGVSLKLRTSVVYQSIELVFRFSLLSKRIS